MGKLFDSIQVRKPQRAKFDLSHERKMTMPMGQLIPFLVQDILPGDKFRVNTEIMMRFAPMLAPIMHRVNVKTDYFFVPNRLVWDEWEDFITGGPDGLDGDAGTYPAYSTGTGWDEGSVGDYLGVPPGVANLDVSLLPGRSYGLIYNEFYRDQDLCPEVDLDAVYDFPPLNIAWS